MRKLSPFIAQGFLILALVALPCLAQEKKAPPLADANRERIISALSRGDTASAEKIFAELSSSVAKVSVPTNVFFEELKACGFYPQETRLECIVDIKQTSGYSGPPGSRASHEFVTFFVDWNCNGSFSADEAVGLGVFHVHDEANAASPVWQYAVYRDIDPPGSLSQQCFMRTGPGGLPVPTTTKTLTLKARAILSWFAPSSTPVWGNTIDFRIRLDPIR